LSLEILYIVSHTMQPTIDCLTEDVFCMLAEKYWLVLSMYQFDDHKVCPGFQYVLFPTKYERISGAILTSEGLCIC